jgi:hypothetical protein
VTVSPALPAPQRFSHPRPRHLDAGGRRLGAETVGGIVGTVGLAEGVTPGDERHGLFVVHSHAPEGHADIFGRQEWIGIAVGSYRIHVDEAHLGGTKWLFQLAVAAVALIAEKLAFGSPVHQVGLPVVLAPSGKAVGLEAHRLQRDVAREDHEVGPRQAAAVLLLDRPQERTRPVEVDVIGPAVLRLESQLTAAGAAAAIHGAVGARAMPGHANEERPVVAIIRRPPVLRAGHQLLDVLLHRIEVEAIEGLGVVEVLAVGARPGRVGAQRTEVELLGPPELMRPRRARRIRLRCSDAARLLGGDRASAAGDHGDREDGQ